MSAEPEDAGEAPPITPQAFLRERARQGPAFLDAVLADARAAAANLMLPPRPQSRWHDIRLVVRMAWEADAFLAMTLIRLAAMLRGAGIPLLPMIARRIAIVIAQVHVGAPVLIGPGIFLPHGQVVIDGIVSIGAGAQIRPFVTIGLMEGNYIGPTIGKRVKIGTGAKILGPVTVGDGARIGANAVVIEDVPAGATVVGVPARVVRQPGGGKAPLGAGA
ncbi:MAG: hypothetical protein AAF371_12975 [Pseudomonadota bacterium]